MKTAHLIMETSETTSQQQAQIIQFPILLSNVTAVENLLFGNTWVNCVTNPEKSLTMVLYTAAFAWRKA